MAKVGAVIYEYYKNAFDGRCEKYTFKACEFDSRQAKLTKIKRTRFRIANFALYFVEFLVKPLRFICELRLV